MALWFLSLNVVAMVVVFVVDVLHKRQAQAR
jgi:hypothetical protein